ncbi:MAG TPA: spore cortex-lytic enzyme [Oscillospiraceae bacterium]|nr:spore cortex-lytic enzyme [Oscillospiraceae bacterium]HPS34154.1 spore cortex-lytic enzyme [Oscillospiraceae bacterium]
MSFRKKAGRLAVFVTALILCISMTAAGLEFNAGAVILKQGSTGTKVKEVQTRLKNWGYYKGSVDGIFGSKTKTAVVWFQRNNGLTQDGIVSAATFRALGIASGGSSGSGSGVAGYSDSDYKLLARLISAEGRGEPYTGMVAIGAVILNRVKHPSFPNTISGVIYQSGAFTALTDGNFNQPVIDSAYKAARDALNGWDPSGGAIYYYNPAKTSNRWMRSRPVIVTIGGHVFCS